MTNAFPTPCRRMVIASANVVIPLGVAAAVWCSLDWTGGAILTAQIPPAAATATPPKFEVATIKRNASGASGIDSVFQPDGRYRAFNMTVRELVANAYRVRGFQVVGGPPWVASERFDVEAKAEDAATFKYVPAADGTPVFPDAPFLMIRELLNDRFKLVVHRETREGPAYALMMIRAGARGPRLRPPANDCYKMVPKPPSCAGIRREPGRFVVTSSTMANLATSLSISLQRLVIDRTGLSERFDFILEWKPVDSAGDPAATLAAEFAPSLLAALDEQLGLKMVAQRAPIDYIVIDSAEAPSDN